MNKSELVDAVVVSTGGMFKKEEVDFILDSIIGTIGQEVANGNSVSIRSVGVFEAKKKDAKKGYNFHTKKTIEIEEHYEPCFKASKTYRRKFADIFKK